MRYAANILLGLLLVISVSVVNAGSVKGRAVIAAMHGKVQYENTGGPADDGDVKEGMAFPDSYRLKSGDGGLCAVLSPGALLCVNENTDVVLKELEHLSGGLPGEGRQSGRRIVLSLERGGIMLHAGDVANDRSIEVDLRDGIKVRASGGSFMMVSDKNGRYIYVEHGQVAVEHGGKSEKLEAGMRLNLKRSAGGWVSHVEKRKDSGLPYDFRICKRFFKPLAPFAFDWDWKGMGALGNWIESPNGVILVDRPLDWNDVSPSVRQGGPSRSLSVVVPPSAISGGGKIRRAEIWNWYKRQGTLRGVNYLPRTAVNSIEMWQEDTFDPDTIDQELEWAEDVKLSSLRVFVPYAVWKSDGDGLKKRMDKFLELAHKHNLSTVFVLFDDKQAKGMEPQTGTQPDPVPGVYNSRWVASPGRSLVPEAAGGWPDLEKYVKDIVNEFSGDKRVLMWDMYNEPGVSGMGAGSVPLLNAAFGWARSVHPEQPLTAGIGLQLTQDARDRVMHDSDVITLADYGNREQMMGILSLASTRGRPVICTGWLQREQRNTFKEILPLFSQFNVGWYNWGLVRGRTQLYIPWNESGSESTDHKVWGQDLLNDDGKPFDEEEIKLIKGFSFGEI
jgi:hypothetical protein